MTTTFLSQTTLFHRPAKADPPRRPAWKEERRAQRLFLALSPHLPRGRQPEPPENLAPWERRRIERRGGGHLDALWYPASGPPRGGVLLAHPWMARGQAFFFRGGRIEALRDAGYHVLTFDLGGFGQSGDVPAGFFDADVADALTVLQVKIGELPCHFWGVSSGGYWSHLLLSRRPGVSGAVFEDTAVHLIEWSKRLAPRGLPFYLIFQFILRHAYRFLDLRRHAPHLRVAASAYIGGGQDRGARADETRELARLASASSLIVPEAGHLEAARQAPDEVLGLALRTFEQAEAARK